VRARGQLGIDEEAQLGEFKNCVVELSCRILERSNNITFLEVRVVSQNLLMARTGGKQVENVGNPKPQPTETWAPTHLLGVNRDSAELAHVPSPFMEADRIIGLCHS
jgi:hypothetical protein